ncbi:homocitrate synthase [Pseudothermotoga thermarum]|uniref:Homocitrate synthase n=1 Tax=Pseudothermotoga thermarum DSM 5069 TaxID=688269 RepID=F7YV21_9THEM|nr:homocitrate synthase [Pseudothermotoga thermarum]AEH50305.1 homocitrate synthase [Pseudothermotoga thermarum DSM 5069]
MTEGNSKKVVWVDTTLRDGEQTAGIVFAREEKIMIAKLLDELGVDQIEVGIPAMGEEEAETVCEIARLGLKASVMAWNRAVIEDIAKSIKCGVDAVAISIAVSDLHIEYKLRSTREKVIEQMVKAVEFAKKEGMYVSVNGEDASRADFDYLVQFIMAAKEAGADRFRYCDTVGILDPITTYEIIKKLKEQTSMDIEIHAHNDLGMATANTVAAIMGGATHASVSVNGLGERAGNAALEEVAMAVKYTLKIDHGLKQEMFKEISDYVAKASGRPVPSWKPIVGENIFAHESGIHVDGALKHPKTYEIFSPEEVGLQRKIIIGKHSGTAALVYVLEKYGIKVGKDDVRDLLTKVRKASISMKRALSEKEFLFLYHQWIAEKEQAKR